MVKTMKTILLYCYKLLFSTTMLLCFVLFYIIKGERNGIHQVYTTGNLQNCIISIHFNVGYRIFVISNTLDTSNTFLEKFSMDEIMACRNFWYLPQPLLSRLSSAHIFKTAKIIQSYHYFVKSAFH